MPNDGTFDQTESVRRCQSKSIAANKSFGYDLSAATDRLPIDLQVSILNSLFNKEFGSHWKNLLVNRDYILKTKSIDDDAAADETQNLRYSVGQPMGALSS